MQEHFLALFLKVQQQENVSPHFKVNIKLILADSGESGVASVLPDCDRRR